MIATGELVEGNGRLLAYTAPWYSGGTADPLPSPRDAVVATGGLQLSDA